MRRQGYLTEQLTYGNVDGDMLMESRSTDKARKNILEPMVVEIDKIVGDINDDIQTVADKIKKKYNRSVKLPDIEPVKRVLNRNNLDDFDRVGGAEKAGFFTRLSRSAKALLSPIKRRGVNSAAARYYYSELSLQILNSFTQMYTMILNYVANVENIIRNDNKALYTAIQNKIVKNLLRDGENTLSTMKAGDQVRFFNSLRQQLKEVGGDGNDYFSGYKNLNDDNRLIKGESLKQAEKRSESVKRELDAFTKDTNKGIAAYAEMKMAESTQKAASASIAYELVVMEICKQFNVERLKDIISDAVADEATVIDIDIDKAKERAKEEMDAKKKKTEEAEKKFNEEAKKEDGKDEFTNSDGETYTREGETYTMTDEDGDTINISEDEFERAKRKYEDEKEKEGGEKNDDEKADDSEK